MTSPMKVTPTGAMNGRLRLRLRRIWLIREFLTNWTRRLPKTVAQMRASPAIGRRMKLMHELLLESRRLAAF